MKKLLLLGESWTTHSIHQKGFDSFTTTEYVEGAAEFTNALTNLGWQVDHVQAHAIADRMPTDAKALSEYGCIVISDVGVNTFQLTPRVFGRSVPDADRLALLADYVRSGGGLVMVGGYLSFAGIDGRARYASSPLAELLPVGVQHHDDRVELPAGGRPEVAASAHAALPPTGDSWPALLGYNKTTAGTDATVLATIAGDPLIAVREVGAGRTAVFTSDMSAHWAPPDFTSWNGYGPLWDHLISWTAGTAPTSAK